MIQQWLQRKRKLPTAAQRFRQAAKRMTWLPDRLLLNDLVFRLEHFRKDDWELGDNCFRFYKVKGLIDLYERLFARRTSFRCGNALELGIWDGGSLAFWFEVLRPHKLVGVDLQKRGDSAYFERYVAARPANRIQTYWGTDQSDATRLRQIVATEFAGPLDLVIDDASHMYHPTRASFETLFPLVRPGGLYIIEDWAWGHWPDYIRPDHPWSREIPLTQLVVELVEAMGSTHHVPTPLISQVTVYEGLIIVERSAHPYSVDSPFRLEQCIIRRSAA